MSYGFKRTAYLFSVATVVALGCAESPEKANETPPAPPPVVQAKVSQTAQEAVQTVLDGLKASKPVVLWNVMDASAQSRTNAIIREMATSIDAEIWDRSVRNLKKLVGVLETKKDHILDNPLWRSTKLVKLDDVKANWKPAVAILTTIVASELVDREKMRNFDGKAFLEGTGAKLYAQARDLTKLMKQDDPLKQFDEMKATLKETAPQNFEVSLQSSDPKEKPLKINLVVRDGHWVVVQSAMLNLALTFRAQTLVARFQPYALIEWKDEYLKSMDRLEKTLDQLQAAKTSGEFQSILIPQVLSLVAQFNRKPKAITPFDQLSRGRDKNTAIVVIKGEHFADEPAVLDLTKTLRRLAEESHAPLSGPQHLDTMTVYFIGQVSDPNALAEKIKAGKIATVDVKRNTVTLELPEGDTPKKNTAANGASKGTAADVSETDRPQAK